ncbi:MAG: ATP-binding protein [Roseburia sp.]
MTITIRTKCVKSGYQVIIEDDGGGFDPNEIKNDERKHVGIDSVRSRIKYMVGGTLIISSEIGKGTRVVIEIPGKEKG